MTAKAKKSALGKGLGALIPAEVKETKTEKVKEFANEVDINAVFPNEEQPRKIFDEEKLQTLSNSIKDNGLIQPVVVRKEKEFYRIIAGERRWRASKLAGLKKIPVIIKDIDDLGVMELSLIENLQREDLNPVEEAMAYKQLLIQFKLTQEEIADKVGKSRPSIANSLRLLNLDERVIKYISDGVISEGHGKVILGIPDFETQFEIAKKIIDDGLNIRQTEKLIKILKQTKKPKEMKLVKDIHIRTIEDKLKGILGTKVLINSGKKKGKIEIEYYSDEDLQRILEHFSL